MSYITFKTLGSAGDLGSQLQQYSSLYAVAKANNKQIVFPESSINKGWGFKFCKLVDIPITTMPDSFFNNFVDIKPAGDKIKDPQMFSLDPNKNYNIDDLFHLYHYWSPEYANDVFGWSWNSEYEQQAKELYGKIKQDGKELVSLHIRRGDYLLPQHHHFCKLDNTYYEEALQPYIADVEKYHFVVFSNDIQWCKDNLIEGDMVTFVEPGIDCVDLILMSLCDHNIIANSSFSWWAAYRNRNEQKRITCPTNYLKAYSSVSIINQNYYPLTWKNIDNDNQ